MLKKLRIKFVLINMGIVSTMLVIIFSMVYYFTKTDLDNKSLAMLESLSHNVQQLGGLRQQEVQLPYFIVQINIRGDIMATGYSYYDLADEAFIQELIQKVHTAQSPTGLLVEYNLRYSRVLSHGMQQLIFVDISSQRVALSSLVQVSVFIGIVGLVVFWGISILLAKRAIRPVEKAWQQQRQFVSDASHELKTPLTVIMSNAELLQSSSYDDQNRVRFVESILSMSHRMRKLVESMLELARADNGQINSAFAVLDFSKLVSDALLPFEPVLYEKGLMLQSDITSGILLVGSEQHLHQLIDVLLDNAAKYTAVGKIKVTLQRQNKSHCLLSVSNPGQPIAAEDLDKIFERFYRTDQARSGTGSFGLGLPIARSITQAHKGRIWAQSNETGNCFYVQLPCQ